LTLYEDAAAGKLFVDINNYGVDPASDQIKETAPLRFTLRLPDWLQGKTLATRVLSPDSPPAVDLATSADRLEVSIDPVRRYAGVVVAEKVGR